MYQNRIIPRYKITSSNTLPILGLAIVGLAITILHITACHVLISPDINWNVLKESSSCCVLCEDIGVIVVTRDVANDKQALVWLPI